MAANIGNDGDDVIAAINITPFVDIILVVLIIFMVTTPLIMNPNIKISLPKASGGDETSEPPQFTIGVTSRGEIYLNGNPTNEADLGAKAREAMAKDKDLTAIISADKESTHGRVMQVMGWAKREGIAKFAISIDKE